MQSEIIDKYTDNTAYAVAHALRIGTLSGGSEVATEILRIAIRAELAAMLDEVAQSEEKAPSSVE